MRQWARDGPSIELAASERQGLDHTPLYRSEDLRNESEIVKSKIVQKTQKYIDVIGREYFGQQKYQLPTAERRPT